MVLSGLPGTISTWLVPVVMKSRCAVWTSSCLVGGLQVFCSAELLLKPAYYSRSV